MGLDIVEIALDKITDHQEFEKIASEVLYNEGYYDIVPMPGGNDFGQDAIEDHFYTTKKYNRIVFQYSLQAYTKSKVEKTIKRLNESKIEFSELVYVTNRVISGENQQLIKKSIRENYGVPVAFFEKETFVNRLSDFSNGIFSRHFPDIDKQVEALKTNKPTLSGEAKSGLELSLLKVSLAFTFNENAVKARKNVFDNLILSLVYNTGKDGLSIEECCETYKRQISSDGNNDDQIKAGLERLKNSKQLEYISPKYKISQTTLKKLEANTIIANQLPKLFWKILSQKYLLFQGKL